MPSPARTKLLPLQTDEKSDAHKLGYILNLDLENQKLVIIGWFLLKLGGKDMFYLRLTGLSPEFQVMEKTKHDNDWCQ